MARAIWTGSVAFGLVNVPVALYSATEDKTIHYNQFQTGTSDRIRYKRVNERTGREVKPEDIVRGHEVAKGDYVLVSDEELEAVEPGRSRTIDITDFVDLAEIDPIYFQKTYYLGPQGDGAAARAYALLHRAMADTGKAGIATFVFHGKQYLVALRATQRCAGPADHVLRRRSPRPGRGDRQPADRREAGAARTDHREAADRLDVDQVESG